MKLVISSRKGLLIYRWTNNAWQYESLHFQGIPICLSYYHPVTGALWAFQDHGHWGMKISITKDFGKSWKEVTAPQFPAGAEVRENEVASLSYVWAAAHVGSDLWLGTVPGGLFRTQDEGSSWELNEALWNTPGRKTHWFGGGMRDPGIHSIVVNPLDPKHMYIGISCAGVYESKDGGMSWAVRNNGLRADFLPDPNSELGHDPHLVVGCPAKPDHLWQQNHCGIFRTTDGAATWTEVTQEGGPAKFGFAVAVDAHNPEVAWVVPGISDEIRIAPLSGLCVCRTEDGGKSWKTLRNGLPAAPNFDIVYRHALGHSGNHLVFGSTTGNVFSSADGGDNWKSVSHFLPMIYAVDIIEA